MVLFGTKTRKITRKFELLKQYSQENGDTKVRQSDSTLGSWLANQRRFKSKGTLSFDKIKLLDSIQFSWDPLDEDWEEKYLQLNNIFRITVKLKSPADTQLFRVDVSSKSSKKEWQTFGRTHKTSR